METRLDVEVDAQMMGLYVPEHGEYTMDEVLTLNMEVTPEIQALLDTMLLEKAMKEAQAYVPQYGSGVDRERQLYDNLDLFDLCTSLTNEVEAMEKGTWEVLRYNRAMWWSLFKEEMDAPWLEYDQFVTKLDKRMREVAPTDEQWSKAMSLKSLIYQRCMRKQQDRRGITYPIYQKALAATEKCKAFWKTPYGRRLSVLKKELDAVWKAIKALDVSWKDYNALAETELNPYLTWGGDDEEEETNQMVKDTYEYMDLLEDASHTEDAEYDAAQSNGPAFWSWKAAARVKHVAKEKAIAEDMEEAYQNSLVSFADEYLCGASTPSNENGAYSC